MGTVKKDVFSKLNFVAATLAAFAVLLTSCSGNNSRITETGVSDIKLGEPVINIPDSIPNLYALKIVTSFTEEELEDLPECSDYYDIGLFDKDSNLVIGIYKDTNNNISQINVCSPNLKTKDGAYAGLDISTFKNLKNYSKVHQQEDSDYLYVDIYMQGNIFLYCDSYYNDTTGISKTLISRIEISKR